MKAPKLSSILLVSAFLFILITCKDREITNPFDTACPKEVFTPSDLKAEQQGASVKLTWVQKNTNISGFIINRNENDGAMVEVAKVDKSVTLWSDNNIVGGKKYGYQLLAYAGENRSNSIQVVITPVSGATVNTASTATGITPYSAVLGGTITSDGGATVTERGICYATSQNPTTASIKVAVGNGIGEFSGTITGLTANTTYYAKAYSINSQGTTYGAQINFSTPALLLTVTPAIYDVPKESGTRVFTVSSNIDWQVTSDQAWCKPNVTSGKGNSPVVAAFEANAAIGQRSAILTFSAVGVSNQQVIITQAGTEPPALSITPASQNVTNPAGTTSFAITSNVSWTATTDQTWCKITNTSGTGNSTLTNDYEANTTNSQRIATLSVTGLGLSAKTVIITQQSAIPTQGLVAYYPFNGNANDESGNGNNGTIYGAKLTTDRKGNGDKAFDFDGIDNYIKINANSTFQPTNSFTLSTWVNIYDLNIHFYILDNQSSAPYYGYGSNIYQNKYLFEVYTDQYKTLEAINQLSVKKWYHIVSLYDNVNLKIFLNGNLVASMPCIGNINYKNVNDKPTIGSTKSGAHFFHGKIDDVRIYNRALTETEIQQLYNE